MVWQNEIDELNKRMEMIQGMGGDEGIRRQHENGKLTVRERIDGLADPGTFQEFTAIYSPEPTVRSIKDDKGVIKKRKTETQKGWSSRSC